MIPTVEQENALIEAVREAARTEIMPRFRNLSPGSIDAKTTPDDLVTEADKRAEARITRAVEAILPGATVVGEEAVSEDPARLNLIASSETCVIVDPVDGTWNFAKGLTIFGVILAVTHKGQTVFGLLYDAVMDDWVMARQDGGAWFCTADGRREKLSITGPRDASDIAGFGSPWLLPAPMHDRFQAGLNEFGRTAELRCSVQHYRSMALGVGGFAVAVRLKPWDHAAGAIVVTEAGGCAGMLDGTDYGPTKHEGMMFVARNEEILSRLRQTFAWVEGHDLSRPLE